MSDHSFSRPLSRPRVGRSTHLQLAPDIASTELGDGAVPYVIALHGDIDIQRRSELTVLVDSYQATDRCTVVVDLREVEFLDSTGLQMFLRLRNVAVERGGSVRLRSPNRMVRRILDVTGVSPLFVLEP